MRSAEEIAERARGEYKSKYITQTNSVEVPIIERLFSHEQLHFVFFNSDTGLRIFEPDGKKREPDSPDSLTEVIGLEGKRFLLITDDRILYIVGKKKEADDELQVFEYSQITSVELGSKKPAIEFSTADGRKYEFTNDITWGSDLQNAAKYISSQIELNASDGSTVPAQSEQAEADQKQASSTENSPGTKFCPDCGAEVEADDTFCSECGTSIDSETKNQTENVENRSNLEKGTESSTDDGGWQSQYSITVWIFSGLVGLVTFPVGLLVPGYLYYKASNGTGAEQTPLETWTVLLTSLVGIAIVEFAGRKGAKILWYLVGGIVLSFILLAIGLA
jgi:predicted nucleic acid-binding Zn ribbon protein